MTNARRRVPNRTLWLLIATSLVLLTPARDLSAQVTYDVVADLGTIGGAAPLGGVVLGADGALYGTTSRGGADDCGLVYRLDPTGALTVVHSFSEPDGCFPMGELALGPDGGLYGVAASGGLSNDEMPTGAGTIYKIAANGAFTVLYRLPPRPPIPPNEPESYLAPFRPEAGLLLAPDGFFYGTLASDDVYRISPDGVFALVHQFFPGGPDGPETPFRLNAALISGTDGYLYSTSPAFEILSGAISGVGTIFRVSLAGEADVLHGFYRFRVPGGTLDAEEGATPAGELAAGPDGEVYGATTSNGPSFETDRGTLFRLDPDRTLTLLHVFSEGADQSYPDGATPAGGLILGMDGHVYGKTSEGGANGAGTIFRLGRDGVFTALRSFPANGFTQGKGRLLEVSPGVFFGTARSESGGIVYRVDLSAPLSISLVAPVGREKLHVGVPTTIEWTATGAASIDVELSRDRGRSFEPIPGCTDLPGASTSCEWTPDGPRTSKAVIRVVAHGEAGGTASDSTTRTIHIKRARK